MQTIRLRISLRWWLRAYLYGVTLMAYALDAEPDMAKVEAMVQRGIKVVVEPVRFGVLA